MAYLHGAADAAPLLHIVNVGQDGAVAAGEVGVILGFAQLEGSALFGGTAHNQAVEDVVVALVGRLRVTG
jgi:hypothetical protein